MTTVVARCSKCNRAANIKCFVDRKKFTIFSPYLTIIRFSMLLKALQSLKQSHKKKTRDHAFIIKDNLDLEKLSGYGFMLGLGRFYCTTPLVFTASYY